MPGRWWGDGADASGVRAGMGRRCHGGGQCSDISFFSPPHPLLIPCPIEKRKGGIKTGLVRHVHNWKKALISKSIEYIILKLNYCHYFFIGFFILCYLERGTKPMLG